MRYFHLLAAIALFGLTAVPAFASGASASSSTANPAAASAAATNAFFEDTLRLAKDQLEGATQTSTHVVPVDSGSIGMSAAGGGSGFSANAKKEIKPVDEEPKPTQGDTETCAQMSTCSSFETCGGSVSHCANTCSNYPSCNVSDGCTPTSAQWSTCNGNGQPTQSCNKSCSTYPTCYSTCNGSGNTCGASPPTCDSWTCLGAPTCKAGQMTCHSGAGSCGPTQGGQSSCAGTPPSYCQNTCSGWNTCSGFDCSSDTLPVPFGGGSGNALGIAMAGLGTMLVHRRRKVNADK